MSELFNALQKLEEKNTPDAAPLPPPVSTGSDKKRKREIPFLKSTVLLIFIVLVTAMSVAFLWYQGGSFVTAFIQPVDSPEEIILPDPDEPLPLSPEGEDTVEMVAVIETVPPLVETGGTKVEKPTASAVEKENAAREDPTPLVEDMGSVINEKKTLPQPIMLPDIPTINREFIRAEQLSEVDESTAFEHRERDRKHVQRKRLIYRAEKLRLQGENPLALALYKKAWEIKTDPDLANNIAAILISFAEYDRAETYLKKGLQLEPDDKDLRYNLEIVRLKTKKNGRLKKE